MIKSETLYNNLLESLSQLIPQKSQQVEVLMQMLSLEKEAVYRRINGKVAFSFSEVAVICQNLGISVDNIIDFEFDKSRPLHIKLTEYVNPTSMDYAMLDEFVSLLRSLKDLPDTEGGEATTLIPQPLYLMYENISKFYLFKWKYLYDNTSDLTPLREIIVTERLRNIQIENVSVAKYMGSTTYILDNLIFQYLVNDIKYFRMVNLITKEEAELIKQDIFQILDDMENFAKEGFFKETGTKIDIYISSMNLSTSFCYIQAPHINLTLIKSFILNGIASLDMKTFLEMKTWMQSLKKQSLLITRSGLRERILFFKEQREIVSTI